MAHKEGVLLAAIKALPEMDGGRILDIGCNSGLYCYASAFAGAAAVTGIDKRQQAVDQAEAVRYPLTLWRGTKAKTPRFLCGDVCAWPSRKTTLASVDVLVACCVLYHLTGGLHEFMADVRDSGVKCLLIQGNRGRARKLDPQRLGEIRASGVTRGTPAPYIFDEAGLRQLATLYGYRVDSETQGQFPVLVCRRQG